MAHVKYSAAINHMRIRDVIKECLFRLRSAKATSNRPEAAKFRAALRYYYPKRNSNLVITNR